MTWTPAQGTFKLPSPWTHILLVFWLLVIITSISDATARKQRSRATRLLCSNELKPHEVWKIMRANLPPLKEMLPEEAEFIRVADIIMGPNNRLWATQLHDMSMGSQSIVDSMHRVKCQRLRHLISVFGVPSSIPVIKTDVANLLIQSITNCHVYQQSPMRYRLPGQKRLSKRNLLAQKTVSFQETAPSPDKDDEDSCDDLLEMVEEALAIPKQAKDAASQHPPTVSCCMPSPFAFDKVHSHDKESPVSPLAEGVHATALDEMSATSLEKYEAAAQAVLQSNAQLDSWLDANSESVVAPEALQLQTSNIPSSAEACIPSAKVSPKRKADSYTTLPCKRKVASKPPVPLFPIITISTAIISELITPFISQFLLPQFEKLRELVFLLDSNADEFSNSVRQTWKHGERSSMEDCLFIELLFRLGVLQRHEIIPETIRDRLFSWLNQPFVKSKWVAHHQRTLAFSAPLPEYSDASHGLTEDAQRSFERISKAAASRFAQNLNVSILSLPTRISVNQLMFCLDLLRHSATSLVLGVHTVLEQYKHDSDIKSYLVDLHIYVPESKFTNLSELAQLLVEYLCQNTLYLTMVQSRGYLHGGEEHQDDSKCEWFPVCQVSSETSDSHDEFPDQGHEELDSETQSLDVEQLGNPSYLNEFDEFWMKQNPLNFDGFDTEMPGTDSDLLRKESDVCVDDQEAAALLIAAPKDVSDESAGPKGYSNQKVTAYTV